MNERLRHVFVCGISRSGTTLLTTILDAAPTISMGYEMSVANLPPADELASIIESACADAGDRPRRVGNLIKEQGHNAAGVFVKRAARALVRPAELQTILRQLTQDGHNDLSDHVVQVALVRAVIDAKMRTEGTSIGGCKVGLDQAGELLRGREDAATLYIVRDPRDIMTSSFERGMPGGVPEIARSWTRLLDAARHAEQARPDRTALVRYEDLVQQPHQTIEQFCRQIGLTFCDEMLSFADSKASVFQPEQRHANDKALRQGFFDTSVGRWERELADNLIAEIEQRCGALMDTHNYTRSTPQVTVPWSERVRSAARRLMRH